MRDKNDRRTGSLIDIHPGRPFKYGSVAERDEARKAQVREAVRDHRERQKLARLGAEAALKHVAHGAGALQCLIDLYEGREGFPSAALQKVLADVRIAEKLLQGNSVSA